MNRSLKKFLYGFLYLSIVALVGYGIWNGYIKAPATCADGIKNQRETEIDCGGECVSCEIKNLAPLEVLGGSSIMGLTNDKAIVLFELYNPNTTQHVGSVTYRVDILSNNDNVMESFDGLTSLYANERKKIIESRVSIPRKSIAGARITLGTPEWMSVEQYARPSFAVTDVKGEFAQNGSVRVSGVAKNNSATTAYDVTLLAIIYDSYGARLFASQVVITSLAGFESQAFSVAFPLDAYIKDNVNFGKTEVYMSSR